MRNVLVTPFNEQVKMSNSNDDEYSQAQKYVNQLLNEGIEVSCDETNENFAKIDELPQFYDEKPYKEGQKFFMKHFLSMLLAKMNGLMAILSVASIRDILILTKMSSSDLSAYRRYMATIFHMMVWYEEDFKPGSNLWKSIAEVRNMHNKTSRRSCVKGLKRISQSDMALTQFGFVGFALARSELVGIHKATEEEWRAFLHVWRVVGHLMGIEDRFNLCTGSVSKTRQICNVLIEQVFRPEIDKRDEDMLSMCGYLVEGLWTFVPSMSLPSAMSLLHVLVQDVSAKNDISQIPPYLQMTTVQKLMFQMHHNVTFHLFKNDVWRVFFNYVFHFSLWLMRNFPFLVYYRFGKKNALFGIQL